MRANRIARDAHPERTPGEVMERPDRPRSWEELDCPDEIELELDARLDPRLGSNWHNAMALAGLATDRTERSMGCVLVTRQAEDCWYAGVPRGRRLVLRRI